MMRRYIADYYIVLRVTRWRSQSGPDTMDQGAIRFIFRLQAVWAGE